MMGSDAGRAIVGPRLGGAVLGGAVGVADGPVGAGVESEPHCVVVGGAVGVADGVSDAARASWWACGCGSR